MPISIATYFNWKNNHDEDKRKGPVSPPKNTTSPELRQEVISVSAQKNYRDLTPNQIYTLLLDNGEYLVSPSTMYRIFSQESLLKHRRKTKVPQKREVPRLTATGPNVVWSWDITYLKDKNVKGLFYYLYLVMDIYSRKIVGWSVHSEESAENSTKLIADSCRNENISHNSLTIHSDNGAPMRASMLLDKLKELKVATSFIRPRVSNDNPFSESLNKHLKYDKNYPKEGFGSIDEAIDWVFSFVKWYNNEHYHSGIKMITPNKRHNKMDSEILLKRKKVVEAARKKNPQKWINKKVANFEPEKEVSINKRNNSTIKIKKEIKNVS